VTITTSRRLEPLVGREGELAALERTLDGLRTPGVRVLAIRGEPGIGKTRLLAELADRAGARGLPVLHGRALEFESAVPFAPVVDALDPYLAVLDARRPVRLDREQLAELSAVFPSLADRPGAEPPALPAERYRLHRAVCALLAALADRRPLVVLLDDLHWADESSLELVAHLLRRPPAARVLLALAYRPRQAPMRLIGMLDHATRGGHPPGPATPLRCVSPPL